MDALNGKIAMLVATYLTLIICCLANKAQTSASLMSSHHRPIPAIEIDAIRDQYFSLEKSLWQHLNRSHHNRNIEQQIRKIVDIHRNFINEHLNSTWALGKYEILNHYEWSILERDLQQIETLFGAFMRILNVEENSIDLSRSQDLDDLMDNILRNDKTFRCLAYFRTPN
ncbi:hypothetical protein EVAR_69758_1 [Eumeta japonica]|uniref:Uncharacterized protein n=1 Tax=Eumeta variegata TaxID=151549 RepID=A0A4C1TGI4_EUMVA|nr:hypothetical protein EVAR_69758_1 [Eumeta japonica]